MYFVNIYPTVDINFRALFYKRNELADNYSLPVLMVTYWNFITMYIHEQIALKHHVIWCLDTRRHTHKPSHTPMHTHPHTQTHTPTPTHTYTHTPSNFNDHARARPRYTKKN